MEVRVVRRSSTRAVPGARAGRIQASSSLCSHGACWLHSLRWGALNWTTSGSGLGTWAEAGPQGQAAHTWFQWWLGAGGRVHRDIVGFPTTGQERRGHQGPVDPFSVLAHSAGQWRCLPCITVDGEVWAQGVNAGSWGWDSNQFYMIPKACPVATSSSHTRTVLSVRPQDQRV